jgi:hypothetical protein
MPLTIRAGDIAALGPSEGAPLTANTAAKLGEASSNKAAAIRGDAKSLERSTSSLTPVPIEHKVLAIKKEIGEDDTAKAEGAAWKPYEESDSGEKNPDGTVSYSYRAGGTEYGRSNEYYGGDSKSVYLDDPRAYEP